MFKLQISFLSNELLHEIINFIIMKFIYFLQKCQDLMNLIVIINLLQQYESSYSNLHLKISLYDVFLSIKIKVMSTLKSNIILIFA